MSELVGHVEGITFVGMADQDGQGKHRGQEMIYFNNWSTVTMDKSNTGPISTGVE